MSDDVIARARYLMALDDPEQSWQVTPEDAIAFARALLAEHDRLVFAEAALASLTAAATGLCDAVDATRRKQ